MQFEEARKALKRCHPNRQQASLVKAEYPDRDGITANIALSSDKNWLVYELDIWNVDLSPFQKYLNFERVTIKTLRGDSYMSTRTVASARRVERCSSMHKRTRHRGLYSETKEFMLRYGVESQV
ncbi:hypothetical protein [Massilia sp. YIM B02763]|uniref:DUF6984 family protein n=1 Tax=Massilia sp. YIM B02763 TaxID=3050130 RepID=UPI0035A64876